MRSTLIRGGTVVVGQSVESQDVMIRGESIDDVGDLGAAQADTVVDAEGLLVLPGAVDTHVHLNDVFMNTVSVHDYYAGTLAAAFGGVTSIIDFSNQVPDGSLIKTLTDKQEEAEGRALIDWGVHPVITRPDDETLNQIPQLVEAGAPTMKCYMTYREDGLLIEDEDLKRIAARLTAAGGMLMLHAEDNDMIEQRIPRYISQGKTASKYHARSKPPEVEASAIRRVVNMARDTGGRFFIVHLASDEGLDLVTAARAKGIDITAETCTHYLIFTDQMLQRDDGIKWICSPPLRNQTIQEALWNGVIDGRLAMVTSDDAAYSWEAKLFGADRFDKCPNGIPAVRGRRFDVTRETVRHGTQEREHHTRRRCRYRVARPQPRVDHEPGHPAHEHRLVCVGRHRGFGQDPQGLLPRRADCRWRSLSGRTWSRPLHPLQASPTPRALTPLQPPTSVNNHVPA
jgi:dihydropyrimidinase